MSRMPKPGATAAMGSFLPEDYLERKADRRAMFISLGLFTLVVGGIVGAFFVTQRQWTAVRAKQETINAEYSAEAKKLEQLKVLEQQKADMMEKAEVTTALIEKIPRSILLAELINRMPRELTLQSFKMEGKRMLVQTSAASVGGASTIANRGQAADPNAPPAPPPKPPVPKFDFTITLGGLALGDAEVADYHSALNQCALLSRVETLETTEQIVEEVALRGFKMELSLSGSVEARNIQPLQVPRLARGIMTGKPTPTADPMDPTQPRDGLASSPTVEPSMPTVNAEPGAAPDQE
jgi:Tfp pilus assembly protein PilN